MKEFDDQFDICPFCGYDMENAVSESSDLPPGTLLHGRYRIGIRTGAGGFGVIYRAWDEKMEAVCAVKEYFPCSIAGRDRERMVVCVGEGSGMDPEHEAVSAGEKFEAGLWRFLDEARRLSRLSTCPHIVDVYDFFRENGTAYIVMEYLDGMTLGEFLEEQGGKLSLELAELVFLPVAEAVGRLHREGMLHRDISPDNIFLLPDGRVKLIDFGAALLAGEKRDTELKPGYAAPEQYVGMLRCGTGRSDDGAASAAGNYGQVGMLRRGAGRSDDEAASAAEDYRHTETQRHGAGTPPDQQDTMLRKKESGRTRGKRPAWAGKDSNDSQGTWTDVYGMGACLFRSLTGKVPQEAPERVLQDQLRSPSVWTVELPEHIRNLILRSMALSIRDRVPDAEAFSQALSGKGRLASPEDMVRNRKRKRNAGFAACMAVLLATGAGLLSYLFQGFGDGGKSRELSVWIRAEEGNEELTEAYYEEVFRQGFQRENPLVTLRVTAIPETVYEDTLLRAMQAGVAPEIFESTGLGGMTLRQAGELDSIVEDLAEGDSYYFLDSYRQYFPEGKRLPTGFTMPVVYVLQGKGADGLTASGGIRFSGDQREIERFKKGYAKYLEMEAAGLPKLLSGVYGTWRSPVEVIEGELLPVRLGEGGPDFTTTFSVREDVAEESLIQSFMEWLLSESEQRAMHGGGQVAERHSFSLLVKANDGYQGIKKETYAVIEESLRNISE